MRTTRRSIDISEEDRDLHLSWSETFRHRSRNKRRKQRGPGVGRMVDFSKSLVLAAAVLQVGEYTFSADLTLLHCSPQVPWFYSLGFFEIWPHVEYCFPSTHAVSTTCTNIMEILLCSHGNDNVYLFCCQWLL